MNLVRLNAESKSQKTFMVTRVDGTETSVLAKHYHLGYDGYFCFFDDSKQFYNEKKPSSVFTIHRRLVLSIEEVGLVEHKLQKSKNTKKAKPKARRRA